MRQWVLWGLLAVLIVVMFSLLMVLFPGRLKTAAPERESILYKPDRPSINYEVFKPALFFAEGIYFFSQAVIDIFRPSTIRSFLCDVAPSRLERVPTRWLRGAMERCYQTQENAPA